jgi:hypothetical protein
MNKMSPLKTYTFENELHPYINIVINAYNYEEAMELLVSVAEYPADFKLVKEE